MFAFVDGVEVTPPERKWYSELNSDTTTTRVEGVYRSTCFPVLGSSSLPYRDSSMLAIDLPKGKYYKNPACPLSGIS